MASFREAGLGTGLKLQLLSGIVDFLKEAILVTDESGKVIFVSRPAYRLLGPACRTTAPEEWAKKLGLFLPDKVTPYPAERLPLMRALYGEEVDSAEIYMKSPLFPWGAWLSVSARPLELGGSEGSSRGAVAVIRDVTFERTSEQAASAANFELQRNEEKYRTIVMNLPGAIYRCDAGTDRRMRFTTAAIREVTGFPPEDFMTGRRAFSALTLAEDRLTVERVIEEALALRRPYIVEYRIRHADGGTRWVYDKGRGICGENGALLWLDGALFDVTDRKLAEAAVLQKTAELARNEAEREQLKLFAFVASHDLKEPLQKIMCYSDLVKMDSKDGGEKTARSIDALQRATMRMGQLIDDILRFTKAATAEATMEPVDLESVVQEVLSDLEIRIRRAGARIEVGPLPSLLADRVQIRQLFQNLIGNAIKFTKPGSSPEIRIAEERRAEGSAVISVEDHGIGFDVKNCDKIFKPFERLHGREFEGSGIGLAICEKIVLRHHGHITADSAPGAGTTFHIELPLASKKAA